MTFKEKLTMEHPDKMNDYRESGYWDGCPYEYGYDKEKEALKNCLCYGGRGCEYCWNREIPNSEPTVESIQYEAVNHPAHYTSGGVECIEGLKAATVGLEGIEAVCTANAIKYLWRWKHKNGIQDLDKAIWYIERLKKEIEDKK